MKYTFITGLGRSGTTFMSYLLNQSSEADVFHDHIGQREYWLLSWYINSGVYTLPYLRAKKKCLPSLCKSNHYIDVNSYLNNDIKSLMTVFNNPKIYHLVRDPRKVISSTFLRIDNSTINKAPKNKNSMMKWLKEDKFYRICYNWSKTIKYLF